MHTLFRCHQLPVQRQLHLASEPAGMAIQTMNGDGAILDGSGKLRLPNRASIDRAKNRKPVSSSMSKYWPAIHL
jgi:hypothetical protein